MATFTYETRRKISENWINSLVKKSAGLSKREMEMLPNDAYYSIPQDACVWMETQLLNKKYHTLSELYRKQFSKLTDICIPKNLQEEFYYALDQMNQYQLTAGWYRRSVRSKSYVPFVRDSILLLRAYSKLQFYGEELGNILTGQVEPEIYDHARTEHWNYSGILAAQIDNGNKKTIQAVNDILLGESNTAMISHELIRGIVKSNNTELYELLGKFLLAAKLQEGARQAVCETMDTGRPEAFLHLFQVIEENNLVRYSSVKRAVSTWIGIFNDKSVDRITDKLVRLMGQCLRDKEFVEQQLSTNDSVAISCALWAKGFYDAEDAIAAELELIRHGTKNQKMTASYFNTSLQQNNFMMRTAKEVIFEHADDMELVSCFMPGFMSGTGSKFHELVKTKDGGGGYFSMRDGEVRKPGTIQCTEYFEDRNEAKKAYDTLRDILSNIPKKGLVLEPCIFPWHKVTMSKSDIAVRMCLIAWMLQEDELLDEAAELIPLIGQGSTYSGATRAAAARVLLYRPKTEKRKDILFELLHNPEEFTMQASYHLVDDMQLQSEDYLKIEQNLKYKKGRERTLALLRKQSEKERKDCIGRLLEMKSEECHMGALDLALGIKKENPKEFKNIKPLLKILTEPTGKEQVLLDELLGENSIAQNILDTPGFGLYNPQKEWTIPPITVSDKEASKLFSYGERACMDVFRKLDALIEENRELSYQTAWNVDMILGTRLDVCRWQNHDSVKDPLDTLPFRELWEGFYEKEIKSPELLLETYFYKKCCNERNYYEQNEKLYRNVFGSGLIKKPPFHNLTMGLRYGAQANVVIDTLFRQYVPKDLKARWALSGTMKFLTVLDTSNDLFVIQEKRYNGEINSYTKRATELPIFKEMILWLSFADDKDWFHAFTMRFRLNVHYEKQKTREKQRWYGSGTGGGYLGLSNYVQSYVRGIWDKDLFYNAVFRFLNLASILVRPVPWNNTELFYHEMQEWQN